MHSSVLPSYLSWLLLCTPPTRQFSDRPCPAIILFWAYGGLTVSTPITPLPWAARGQRRTWSPQAVRQQRVGIVERA
jgi:hypothetical protein